MKYTKHQLEALNYRGGNLLIIACAGSGKTQVLSRRIALLVSEGTPRDSIVAFTFTDMAAGELKSRIRKEMANLQEDGLLEDASLGDMYVGTIHSFSLQLLKELDASYRNYEIIDEKRQAAIIVSQYENFGLEQLNGKSKIDTIKRFIETLEILYRENINADTLSNPVLVEAIKRYNNFLKSSPNCFLTFNEIIAELTLRLQMDNTLLNQVREKFTNIFVDEYQDVDDRQELLISLLSDTGRAVNICAVGDDDQAIYRFRGATVENILNFSTKYPNVKSIAMTSNFRSTHAVVEIANTAVSGCKIGRKNVPGLARRLPKTMEAKHYSVETDSFEETMSEHGDIWNCTFSSEDDEAEYVVDRIQELVGLPWNENGVERGLSYADMAVLCRSINYARPLMDELDKRDIKYIVKGAKGLFENREIKIIHTAFCLISNSQYVIPDPDRYNHYLFYDEAQTRDVLRTCIDFMRDTGRMPGADSNTFLAWIAQKSLLVSRMRTREDRERYNLPRRLYPQDIFYEMLEQLGANLAQWDEAILYNLGRFSELILAFESVHQWVTPSELYYFTYYLGYWVAREANDIKHQDIGGQNAIQITTVHQAKGLEWPVVFIPAMTSRRFPSQMRNAGDEHLLASSECLGRPRATDDATEVRERFDEELRLWYVALTRSKKFLYISGIERPKTHQSEFAANIRHNYVSTDPNIIFDRPNRIDSVVPIDATLLPTSFSDLSYYWNCPHDYQLRRLMGFSPGVSEGYGYGQQIHNFLALLHDTIVKNPTLVNDNWVDTQIDRHFNLRYTRGDPLDAMKAAAKRIIKRYIYDDPNLSSKVLKAEKPFEFIIGDALISGTIDLLNRVDHEDANDRVIELVDFKTGKLGEDLDVNARIESVTKQLLLYAIASEDALGYDPQLATAHFLCATSDHRRINIDLIDDAKEHMKHEIERTVESIKSGRFPHCSNIEKCKCCDFKAICTGVAH